MSKPDPSKILVDRIDLANLFEAIRLFLNDIRKEDIRPPTAKALTATFDAATRLVNADIPREIKEQIADLIEQEPGKPGLSARDIRKLCDVMLVLFYHLDLDRLRREDKSLLLDGMQLVTRVTPPPTLTNSALQSRIVRLISDVQNTRGPGEAV